MKIYATDIDEGALSMARQGAYPQKATEVIAPELREKYFESVDSRSVFRTDLRRSIIFGRHDLTVDAPISRLDLLVCRNTLMYLNAESQAGVLDRFNFALDPAGFLILGRAEMMLSHPVLFQPVDMKARIFGKFVGGPKPEHRPVRQRRRARSPPTGCASSGNSRSRRRPSR